MVARRPTQTVLVAGVPVQTTVTARPAARPAVVRQWVYTTRWRLSRRRHRTVGLGVQWTPQFRAGADERPDTLQLCVGSRCLVFQIARAGGRVPMVLRRFLADRLVKFAAYNVATDCRKLRAHHGLEVASTMELRRASGMGNASMERMADKHLGIRGITRSRKVGVSKWFVSTLSKKQVRYACVDAYLSYRLGVRLRHNDEASKDDGIREDYGRREVFAIGVQTDRYEEDDGVREDYDDEDYKEIDGPEYDPQLYDVNRMVGAIFAMPVSWDVQDDCNACFPEDPEEMMEEEEEEEAVFPSIVGVLA